MKPKNKIYPLLRMLAVALTAALLGPGCQKDFKWNEPLAVTQNGLNLTSPAGSTRVTVYSTGRWKAEMAEGAWGEVSEVSGNGIGDFLFTYEANNGVSRRARILVSGEGEEQEIVLTQAGAVTEPTLALAETEFEFVRLPRERVQIGVTTNMTQALECILITATDVTDAENPAEAGWLKEIRLEKDAEENIVLVFGIDRNDGSSDRKAAIRLEIPDADGKILAQAEASVVQTTDNATVVFKDEDTIVSVPGDQHNRSALLTANFDVDPAHFAFDIAYDPAGTQWITDVTFSESAVSFVVAENTGDQPRSASLKITYKDTDVECSSTLRLTQEVKQLSIADLRALIPGAEGEVELTGEKMLSAVVISDAGNYNMETNPNLTDTSIDFSVNEKTAYIESLDGQYGLRIVTKLPADNILKRYSSVQLSINGLKLVKESNPERYTLTGFTKEHVLNQNAGTAADLPKKEKHISELTDADIYTYVTLKECEFMLNGGAYINVHDGYCYKTDLNTQGVLDPRFDCAIRGVIDSRGEKINMVLNTQVRWRRKGDGVPGRFRPHKRHHRPHQTAALRRERRRGHLPDPPGRRGRHRLLARGKHPQLLDARTLGMARHDHQRRHQAARGRQHRSLSGRRPHVLVGEQQAQHVVNGGRRLLHPRLQHLGLRQRHQIPGRALQRHLVELVAQRGRMGGLQLLDRGRQRLVHEDDPLGRTGQPERRHDRRSALLGRLLLARRQHLHPVRHRAHPHARLLGRPAVVRSGALRS